MIKVVPYVLASGWVACGDPIQSVEPLHLNRGIIQGTVKDAETRLGVGGIEAAAFFDGEWHRTKTRAGGQDPADPERGTYKLSDVPPGVLLPIRFSGQQPPAELGAPPTPYATLAAETIVLATDPSLIVKGASPLPIETPTTTLSVALVPANAALSGVVMEETDPLPAGTRLKLSLVFDAPALLNGIYEVLPPVQDVTLEEGGAFTIPNLPKSAISQGDLAVLPLDLDPKPGFEYGTWTNPAPIDLATSTRVVIDLRAAKPAPEIVWSSVEPGGIRSVQPDTSKNPIAITFSIPMDPSLAANVDPASGQPIVTLVDQAGKGPSAKLRLALKEDVRLEILTASDLERGQTYKLTVFAARARSARGKPMSGTDFVLDFRAVGGGDVPDVTGLNLRQDPGSWPRSKEDVNWNTPAIHLEWDAWSEAAGYVVYARDSKRNSDWINVTPAAATAFLPRGAKVVAIVTVVGAGAFSQFDVHPSDDADLDDTAGENPDDVTLFADGNEITFAVVAVDRDGKEGALPTDASKLLRAKDLTPPTCTLRDGDLDGNGANGIQPAVDGTGKRPSGAAPGDNGAGTGSKILYIRLRCSEYMDVGSKPSLQVFDEGSGADCPDAGSAGANTTTPASAPFVWTNGREGHFALTIPAGANERADCGKISWGGMKDSSGNVENTASPSDEIRADLR